jgi:predicted negative regulator of RcsB-dependent stress response
VDENLTDQQRAEQIRTWLTENGWYLLAGLVLGLVALFGWREWSSRSVAQAEQASAIYEELLGAIQANRAVRADEHASSPYLDLGRLAMAKMKMERSAPEEAAAYLAQVMKKANSEEIASIARLRLGRVLIQQEKYAEALDTLEVPAGSAFAARFHEARGDAYYAMGKAEDARREYEAALAGSQLPAEQAFLEAKLAEVSGPAPPADAAAAVRPAPAR